MTDFGNQSWLLFVVMAYGAAISVCLGFGLWSYMIRRAAIRSLGDEGFLSADEKENR